MSQYSWQKSSFSGTNANCVEIAIDGDHIYIRESDDPTTIVTTTRAKLHAWLRGAKAGEFDHLTA
ncbi:DUF397 domain-containing protein [Streptomyces kaniharaensis]|uniref:DUF397 domain-containing protein n=1 Tax=Streptomyces kaniharaensis TaxID=212423 RepID=A0A6N7KSN9_9ACTN|nr:DUF397 domain-containing protein [Streptomyces kaniharaensis]MQS13599.1 DUF397 domain-containing protein [Streptomyces kaniharaensis]